MLEPYGDLTKVAVQLGVVDGDRGTASQILAEAEVSGTEAPAVLARHPGYDTEHTVLGLERHHHRTAEVQLADHLELFPVDDSGLDHLVGDLWRELADAGAQHLVGACVGVRVGGIPALELLGDLELLEVNVGN